MAFLHRLAISGNAAQLFVDFVGFIIVFSPVPPNVKQVALLTVIGITAFWDVAMAAYLHWVPVTPVGGPTPAWHMSRRAIKTGLFTATFALLFALVALALLLVNVGFGVVGTLVLVGIFLFLTTIQDIGTTIVVLRR